MTTTGEIGLDRPDPLGHQRLGRHLVFVGARRHQTVVPSTSWTESGDRHGSGNSNNDWNYVVDHAMTSTGADDMVEVVARAMARAFYRRSYGEEIGTIERLVSDTWPAWSDLAFAANAALRDRMPVLAWRPIDDGARSGAWTLARFIGRGSRPAVARWKFGGWEVDDQHWFDAGKVDAYIPLDPVTGLPVGGTPVKAPLDPNSMFGGPMPGSREWRPIISCPTDNTLVELQMPNGIECRGMFSWPAGRWKTWRGTVPSPSQPAPATMDVFAHLPEGVFPVKWRPIAQAEAQQGGQQP